MINKIAVVGGGIFGVTIAVRLGNKYVVDLYEKENDILKAASGINQYRAHRGYHYPRSESTVKSCQEGERSFREEYADAMMDGNDHYYCIARNNSFLSGAQFLSFCDRNDLEYRHAKLDLVNHRKLDAIVKVKESLINPKELYRICRRKLTENRVNILLNTKATSSIFDQYDKVIICTYANTNELLGNLPEFQQDYQYELCEKIVVEMPITYRHKSIVIMDGPFMCVDPFGKTSYSLWGNVVHAIHSTNVGRFPIITPQYLPLLNNGLIRNPPITRFKEFVKSGSEYIPGFKNAKYVGSMFTVRTVLPKKDKTDERPTVINFISDKIITVYSGKLINCVDAAKELESYLG